MTLTSLSNGCQLQVTLLHPWVLAATPLPCLWEIISGCNTRSVFIWTPSFGGPVGPFCMVMYDPSLLSCPSSLTPLIALVFLKHMEFIIQQTASFAISALINCSPLHFHALILSKSTHWDRLMAPHMHQCQPLSHDQIRRNGIPYLFFSL